MNWGPCRRTMSFGDRRFLNMCERGIQLFLGRDGNPRSGINLQDWRIRFQRQLGWWCKPVWRRMRDLVAKSPPRWDQGRWGMGKRDQFHPLADGVVWRRWHRSNILWTSERHPGPCWATSNRFWRSERVRCLPGCPDPREVWTGVQKG